MNENDIELITSLVRRGFSHALISQHFQHLYPNTRGYSSRSIRRICRTNHITRITDNELDIVVGNFITHYGHTYGRAMMQGSVNAALGITHGAVSQRRVSRALRRLAPDAFEARTRDMLVRTNPIPYYAPYFGYKVHMDQNEKIAQSFGCTHIALIDGCSRMICGFISMPVKNPILIYELVFRPALLEYGLWDQLRVDHGKEFFLCIFVQELLKHYRTSERKRPWAQTPSTDNYVVERIWPEVNSRVNYPVKRAFIFIIENFGYDLADPIFKFCVSYVCIFVVNDACKHLVRSWNHHRVPGSNGCIPIENMTETKNTATVPEQFIPTAGEAVRMYEEMGGQLNQDPQFGIDPLFNIPHAFESRKMLFHSNQSAQAIFSEILQGRTDSLVNALNLFHMLTLNLSTLENF